MKTVLEVGDNLRTGKNDDGDIWIEIPIKNFPDGTTRIDVLLSGETAMISTIEKSLLVHGHKYIITNGMAK